MLFFGVGMLIETRVVSPSRLCGECQFVVFSLFQAVACSLREWSYCFRLLWPTVVFSLCGDLWLCVPWVSFAACPRKGFAAWVLQCLLGNTVGLGSKADVVGYS